MSSLNRVTLLGNLGIDPETRNLQNGSKMATFRMATSESWRDKSTGERREVTDWHLIVIYNENLVKIAEQYLRKGSKVLIEGMLKTRKWQDQEGKDRYTTEVVLKGFDCKIIMVGAREDRGAASQGATTQPTGSGISSRRDDMNGDEVPF